MRARELLSADTEYLPIRFRMHITDKSFLAGALEAAYSAPFRHYHTLQHIADMLTRAKMVGTLHHKLLSNELYLAILFHDSVYDLHAHPTENERASSILCSRMSYYIFDDSINLATVTSLIMATSHTSDLNGMSEEMRLIADLDMGGFGADTATFLQDNDRVTDEYLTAFDRESVLEGRIAFLKAMRAKPQIFYTRFFSEDMAKLNIDIALHNLENS